MRIETATSRLIVPFEVPPAWRFSTYFSTCRGVIAATRYPEKKASR